MHFVGILEIFFSTSQKAARYKTLDFTTAKSGVTLGGFVRSSSKKRSNMAGKCLHSILFPVLSKTQCFLQNDVHSLLNSDSHIARENCRIALSSSLTTPFSHARKLRCGILGPLNRICGDISHVRYLIITDRSFQDTISSAYDTAATETCIFVQSIYGKVFRQTTSRNVTGFNYIYIYIATFLPFSSNPAKLSRQESLDRVFLIHVRSTPNSDPTLSRLCDITSTTSRDKLRITGKTFNWIF